MIDTIEFGIAREYEIQPNNKLVLRRDTNQENGEFFEKFYFNDDVLNLTIDYKGLAIKTNLSKLYGLGDVNLYPLGANSFEACLDNLQRKLDDIGIIADLDSAKIWRLDLFKNVKTSQPYQAYKPIFEMLNLKRAKNRIYPEGYLTGNSLRELMFYNKVKELANKVGWHYVRELGFNSETLARGELRFLKAREVKRNGIEYLKELPDKWEHLKEVYQNYMEQVFKYEMKGDTFEMDAKVLEVYINNAMFELIFTGKEALKVYGYFPYSFVNKGDLLNALLNHFSRPQAYKVLSNIEKYKSKTLNNESLKRLYDELKDKFLERR